MCWIEDMYAPLQVSYYG